MAPFKDIFKIISALIKIADISLKARALKRRRNASRESSSKSEPPMAATFRNANSGCHDEQEYDSDVDS
ncbi:uncharacterized protein SPSK_11021 [Sporothrix schenckii 1099-18]|uniref:Uncharacterized protein n=1 Tax=Sporothrix schenckii 1099-18 TaxID=1397361 RepID=A0A0F2MAF0_SPOSC|nr:uncharacterized protein SPSK_11021 [Sporothrix schenckii 1099-18]KJR86673.1 hypothetical protein SPSK_11021 [Sporothrix schenckii 1099-18]